MIKARVDTSRLDAAISQFIGATGKEIGEELARQGKFLAYELAAVSPPAAKGQANGLSPGNRKSSEAKIKRALEFFIRKKTNTGGAWATAQVAAENDVAAFQQFAAGDGWYKGANSGFSLTASASGAGGAIMRIMNAAKTDPARALKNIRQYLKHFIAEAEREVLKEYNNDQAAVMRAYYEAIGKRARRQRSKVVKVGGPQGGQGNTDRARAAIRRTAFAAVGGIKAGWVQAGDALPATISISRPGWLAGKKQSGRGSLTIGNFQASLTIANSNANPAGIEDRTKYVQKAIDNRERKILFALEGAIKHLAQKSFPNK